MLHKWLSERNIFLEEQFADMVKRLSVDYKKTKNTIVGRGIC